MISARRASTTPGATRSCTRSGSVSGVIRSIPQTSPSSTSGRSRCCRRLPSRWRRPACGFAVTGRALCSLRQTLLLRVDGGFGGPPPVRSPTTASDRGANLITQVTLSPRAALIYRMSGDWNPLHLDPRAAEAAGFERPIMHGLGVYGTVAAALCRTLGRSPRTCLAPDQADGRFRPLPAASTAFLQTCLSK